MYENPSKQTFFFVLCLCHSLLLSIVGNEMEMDGSEEKDATMVVVLSRTKQRAPKRSIGKREKAQNKSY